jgi:phage tail-like protein
VIAGSSQQRIYLSIILIDRQWNDNVRWDVRDALPVKWGVSELKADGNTVAVETLELVHHGFTRAE